MGTPPGWEQSGRQAGAQAFAIGLCNHFAVVLSRTLTPPPMRACSMDSHMRELLLAAREAGTEDWVRRLTQV